MRAVVHVRALGRFPFFKIVLITNAARLDSPGVEPNPALAAAIARGLQGSSPAAAPGLETMSGALAGVVGGRRAFPTASVMRLLTRRPDAGLGVRDPRPETCWTDDLVDLAEALLCQGQRAH